MAEIASEPSLEDAIRRFSSQRFGQAESHYELTRWVLLRGIAFIYLIGFLVALLQFRPLCGARGLLPTLDYFGWVAERLGSRWDGFFRLPSVFWVNASDTALFGAALLGVAISLLALFGFCNAITLFVLWALYLSFVHAGQIFYGYGWESLLCEAGFLSIFMAPGLDLRAFSARAPPALVPVLLFRWLTFRLMLGAGLIKWRGDPCWRELTCLAYHYLTQPNPGPLSRWFHELPLWVHELGVAFNHLVELIAPFGVFGPRPLRLAAGALIVAFQVVLILSGNLSFLNWLTLVIALACFDDGVFARLLPRALRERGASSELGRKSGGVALRVQIALGVVVLLLSLNPVVNMLSARQAMNASFDPFLLVNTYGAFGSVSRERLGVVLEGTYDPLPSQQSRWQGYELPSQVGDPARAPVWITPYHRRLDWQMWFVPLAGPNAPPPPWLVHLVARLLEGDALTLSLFRANPFSQRAPRYVRVALYRFRFSRPSESGYWQREYLGNVIGPISRDDPELVAYLASHGLR